MDFLEFEWNCWTSDGAICILMEFFKKIMELFIDIITGLCFFIGSLSIIIGACGLIKLPDVFSRIHAAGMIDTGGTAFFLLGMILQTGWSLITVKLILIGVFVFFTSPVTSHVTANLARQKNLMPVGKKIGKLL